MGDLKTKTDAKSDEELKQVIDDTARSAETKY